MEWRVTIELSGAEGTKQIHEVGLGEGSDPLSILDPLGLTRNDSKILLGNLQRHRFSPGSPSTARCAAAARTAGASAC